MFETNEDVADFEFDPDQLSELGELAAAFILYVIDAELTDELHHDYL